MISALLPGLDPAAHYMLIVRAGNHLGLGNPSMITINTKVHYNTSNNRPGRENSERVLPSKDDIYRKQKIGNFFGHFSRTKHYYDFLC